MARKNETVIAEIETEANTKGVAVPVTEGKSNAELEVILIELKAPPAPPVPNDFVVAPGVSITTKGARILADGDEITEKDIPAESFKAFLKSGHIVKG